MRVKKILLSFIVVSLLIFNTGCSDHANSNTTPDDANSKVQVLDGAVQIFSISRETFQAFLNEQKSYIISNVYQSQVYSESGAWHTLQNITGFVIDQSFIDLFGNQKALEEYLSENGVDGAVEELVIFETSGVPVTAWIRTSVGNIYITVDEETGEGFHWTNEYVYKIYTQEEYTEKYQRINARLIVFGREIATTEGVELYNNSAQLPFKKVMKTLGASIVDLTPRHSIIFYNGKSYFLDTHNCTFQEIGAETDNLFFITGGVYYFYNDGTELMVGTGVLGHVLSEIDGDVVIECDRKAKTVTLKSKSGDIEAKRTAGITFNVPLIGITVIALLIGRSYFKKRKMRRLWRERTELGETTDKKTGDGFA